MNKPGSYWDHLATTVALEEKDEKLEGDAALNKLFQQIYADGNDELKKAMSKSFVRPWCMSCYLIVGLIRHRVVHDANW